MVQMLEEDMQGRHQNGGWQPAASRGLRDDARSQYADSGSDVSPTCPAPDPCAQRHRNLEQRRMEDRVRPRIRQFAQKHWNGQQGRWKHRGLDYRVQEDGLHCGNGGAAIGQLAVSWNRVPYGRSGQGFRGVEAKAAHIMQRGQHRQRGGCSTLPGTGPRPRRGP